MYRKAFKFVIMTITILTVNLLTGLIGDLLIKNKHHYKPLTFTLIAMAIITIILYPLYSNLEVWLTKLSTKIVKSGKSLGGKYLGLILMFALCLAVLAYFYARMWYHIDLFNILVNGRIGKYI
jgi:hypothetical protein